MRLLRYWIWRRPCRSMLRRRSGSVKAVLAWPLRPPDASGLYLRALQLVQGGRGSEAGAAELHL